MSYLPSFANEHPMALVAVVWLVCHTVYKIAYLVTYRAPEEPAAPEPTKSSVCLCCQDNGDPNSKVEVRYTCEMGHHWKNDEKRHGEVASKKPLVNAKPNPKHWKKVGDHWEAIPHDRR